ncbi:MAG: isoleucine--tRNA ligase, partial [Candidatus Omnitrophota bacterium]
DTSPSVFIKFQLQEMMQGRKTYAVVWTTTPWTLLANVAIAVHPDFKYSLVLSGDELWIIQEDLVAGAMEKFGIQGYSTAGTIKGRDLEGLAYNDIFTPPRRKDLKVVLADYVSKEDGSGCVHTAPGHGQEDYLTGQRYNLETLMPVDNKGCFCQDIAGEFKGQHVFDANKNIINRLKESGSLLYSGQIAHSYPHCWRCKTPIIFRATSQWFMDINKEGLRDKLLKAVDKDITWVPSAGKERIAAMISLRPDWCLSRQRYWGVPIPALYCKKCGEEKLYPQVIERFADIVAKEGTDSWFKMEVKDIVPAGFTCPDCQGADFEKADDILDVWFDSGVSHQAVLKKRAELAFPADLYLEGSDQHRGWFQASLISSMAIESKPPFKAVLTHGFVVDGEGRKMSKSMGNVISPQEIIKDYGADILRLWVASSDYNEDIRISPEILKRLSEAYRKVRNTVRFILSNLYDFDPASDKAPADKLKKMDQWILARAARMFDSVNKAYEDFEFYKAYKGIYDFCNEDLSMSYLDMVKGRLYTCAPGSQGRRGAQTAMYEVLNALLRLMAPVLAFTAEEIWQYMPKTGKDASLPSVHLLGLGCEDLKALLRGFEKDDIEEQLAPVMGLLPDIAKALEEKRAAGIIGSSFDAGIIILTNDEKRYTYLGSLKSSLPEIFKVSQADIQKSDDLGTGAKNEKYPDLAFIVKKAEGVKCVRCWNYSVYVGASKSHPQLCEKCLEAIREENSK